jgi:hypothetical protein
MKHRFLCVCTRSFDEGHVNPTRQQGIRPERIDILRVERIPRPRNVYSGGQVAQVIRRPAGR